MPFAKMCVLYKIGDPLPEKLSVATLDPLMEGKESTEITVSYISKPVICKGCNSLGHQVGACPLVKRMWVQKQQPADGTKPGDVNTKPSNADAQTVNQTAPLVNRAQEPQSDARDQERDQAAGEWTQVTSKKSKNTRTTFGTSVEEIPPQGNDTEADYTNDSPSPANTFRNLKKVDEIDAKRAASTFGGTPDSAKLSKTQLKRQKKSGCKSPPPQLS